MVIRSNDCRNCHHYHKYLPVPIEHPSYPYEIGSCHFKYTLEPLEPCTCNEFIPADNLEYCQWVQKKREKNVLPK